jgi:hypothetical protein
MRHPEFGGSRRTFPSNLTVGLADFIRLRNLGFCEDVDEQLLWLLGL